MAKLYKFSQGDEVVLVHRQIITTKDDAGIESTIKKDTELSSVRVPLDCHIGGGTMEPEYSADPEDERKDKRQLVVRYDMR
jgi:hypothetical protein